MGFLDFFLYATICETKKYDNRITETELRQMPIATIFNRTKSAYFHLFSFEKTPVILPLKGAIYG